MTIKANTLGVTASFSWTLAQSNSPFANTTQGADSLSFTLAPNTTTFSLIQLGNTTLNANASVTVNLASYTDLLNVTRSPGNTVGVFFKGALSNTSNTGGKIAFGPGDSNAATWFFASNSNTNCVLTFTVGANGCCFLAFDGAATAVGSSSKNLKFANPGTNAVTLTYGVIQGA